MWPRKQKDKRLRLGRIKTQSQTFQSVFVIITSLRPMLSNVNILSGNFWNMMVNLVHY